MIDPITLGAAAAAIKANEKLLFKVIDILTQTCGTFFEPWRYKRLERAKICIREEADLCREISAKVKNSMKLIPTSDKKDHTDYIKEFPTNLVRQVNEQTAIQFLNSKEALLRSGSYAVEKAFDVNQCDEISDEMPNASWILKWKQLAQEATQENLQRLWGAILAGELQAPGSYSLKTLHTVSTMTTEEAYLLKKLAPFVLDNQIYRPAENVLAASGISLGALFCLEEHGIIKGLEKDWGYGLKKVDPPPWYLFCNDKALVVFPNDIKTKSLEINGFDRIAKVGKEILSLESCICDMEYLKILAKGIKDEGYVVKVGDVSREQGNRLSGEWWDI